MYIIRNLLKFIFVYIPILLVLIGTYFFAHKNYDIILDNLENITSVVLSKYMNTDIKAEKIIIYGTKIIIYNIDIKDQKNNNLVKAKKVFVKLSPFSKKQICKSIYIDSANANITEENNKWNFDFIVNKFYTKENIESKYTGPTILIVNSNININSSTYKYKDNLKNVCGRMDFSNKDHSKYALKLSSKYAKNINVYANHIFLNNNTKIKVQAEKLNLELINYYKNHIKDKKYNQLKKCQFYGLCDSEANLNISKSRIKNFNLIVQGENTSIKSPYGSLTKGIFNIKSDNKTLTYKIKGQFNHSNIYTNGQINLKDYNDFQGKLIAKNVHLNNFKTILPKDYKSLQGICNISATINNLINPHISGKIKGKNITFNKYLAKTFNTKFELKNKVCNYQLTSTLKGGKVHSHGSIYNLNIFKPNINNITTNSLVCLRDINLKDYIPYQANILGDFSIKGNITNPNIKSNIEIRKGIFNLNKIKYENINANLSLDYNNKKLNIKSGLIQNFNHNNIIFKGNIDQKLNCNLLVDINNINLEKISKDYNLNLKGIGSIKSHIIKNEKLWTKNLINLEDFSYNNIKINFAQIDFNADTKNIKINNCTILDFPATLSFNGNIYSKNNFNFKKPIYFNLKLDENNLTTKKICEKLNKDFSDIRAITKGELELKGILTNNKFEDLSGKGNINIANIKYKDFLFNSINTKVKFEDTIVKFYDIKGNANTYTVLEDNIFGNIIGQASYDINDNYYKGNLSVNNINITEFRNYYKNYINLFGLVNFDVDFNGKFDKLNANIKGNINRLTINSKNYETIPINLTIKESDIINGDFTCKRGEQYIEGKIKDLSLKKQNIENLNIKANQLEVNDLREIFYLSPIAQKPQVTKFLKNIPTITGGNLEGELNIFGNLKELNGNCDIKCENINADFDRINRATAKLNAKKGVINLENLELEGTEFLMTCDAYPLFDKNNTKINVSLVNLPLERFGKYIKMNNFKGTLSAESLIEGNLSEPNVTSSITIDDPVINNIEMQKLQVAKIDIDNQYITFPQGINLFLTEDNLLKLEGKIPVSIFNKNSNDEFDFKLSAPKQNLNILEKLSPYIVKDSTKGSLYADIDLKGTIGNAKLNGLISIDNGELITLGNTKLNNINSTISLSNDENGNVLLNIDKFSFADSKYKDESFTIKEGQIKIFNSRQNNFVDLNEILKNSDIKILANLDNYFIKSQDFSTYQDKSNAIINGQIIINGNILEPKIYTENPIILSNLSSTFKTASSNNEVLEQIINSNKNKVLFSYRDAIEYDEIKIVRNRDKKLLFNPSFNMEFITNKAEIRPPSTYIKANGNVSIIGDLNNPIIKGEGTVIDGRTNFQIARARIVKGSNVNFSIENNLLSGNIDAQAFSYIHCNDKTGTDQRYKVNILIDGNLNDPNIQLVSDPEGLTTNEIITAFTGFSNNTINAQETLAKIGANTILSPIEDLFVEYLGLDSLGFEYKQNNYAIINIEKSFNNKFYGSFYSNLYNKTNNTNMSNTNNTDLPLWELKLGYRLNSRFKFDVGINSKKEKTTYFNYGFRF